MFSSGESIYVSKKYKASTGSFLVEMAEKIVKEMRAKEDVVKEFEEFRFMIKDELFGVDLEDAHRAYRQT